MFSSFIYNPPDKTSLATIKTGSLFEEMLKKYWLKFLSLSLLPTNDPLRLLIHHLVTSHTLLGLHSQFGMVTDAESSVG